jgi:predicted ferric reductase
MHVAFSVLALLTLYRHRLYFQTKTLIFVIICGALFAIDKHFRIGRYAYFRSFRKTTETLHPLPNGGTRVVVNQSIRNTQAGLHARLWIPKIRKLQTHPMTMISTSPVTFAMSAQTCFTVALHEYASSEPGATINPTFDGPYGWMPPFERYDTTILAAGGSGAAWTFAVCMDLLIRNPEARIESFWAVRNKGTLFLLFLHLLTSHPVKNSTNEVPSDTLKWFENEIQTPKTMSHANLFPHVTDASFWPPKASKQQARPGTLIAPGSWELVQHIGLHTTR